MRKTKIFLYTFLFILLFFTLVFFGVKPLLTTVLPRYAGFTLNYDSFTLSPVRLSVENLKLKRKDFLDADIRKIDISFNYRSLYSGEEAPLIEILHISDGRVKLGHLLMKSSSEDDKAEKREKTIPLSLPPFPFAEIDIKDISVEMDLGERKVALDDIFLKGRGEYSFGIERITFEDLSLKRPLTGSMSANFSASGREYRLSDFYISSYFLSLYGKGGRGNVPLNAQFSIDAGAVMKLADLDGSGFLKGSTALHLMQNGPVLKGEINGMNVRIDRMNLWDFHLDFALNRWGYVFDRLLIYDGNRSVASLKGRSEFDSMKIEGIVDLYDLELSDIIERVGEKIPVDLSVAGRADFLFDIEKLAIDYDSDFNVKDFDLTVDDYRILASSSPIFLKGTGTVDIEREKVFSREARLTTPDKRTDIAIENSFFGFGDRFAINIKPATRVDFKNFGNRIAGVDVSDAPISLSGKIHDSAYENPEITARISSGSITAAGFTLDKLEASGRLEDMKVDITANRTENGSFSSRGASVHIDIDNNRVDFAADRISGSIRDISSVINTPIPLEGKASFKGRGSVENGRLERLEGVLSTGPLSAQDLKVADSLQLRIGHDDDSIFIKKGSVAYGNSLFSIGGKVWKSGLVADLRFKLDSFHPEDFALPEEVTYIAPLFEGSVRGTVFEPEVEARIFAGKVAYGDLLFGNLSLMGTLNSKSSLITLSGDLGKAISIRAKMEDYDIEKSEARLSVENFSGIFDEFTGALTADAQFERGSVSINLKKVRFERAGVAIWNNAPLKIKGRPERLKIEPTVFESEGLNVSLSGEIVRGEPKVDFRGMAHPARMMNPFMETIDELSGNILFDLRYDSTISGRVGIRNGGFFLKPVSTPVNGLNGDIVISENRWDVGKIIGTIGSGKLSLKGGGSVLPDFDGAVEVSVNNANVSHKLVGPFSLSTLVNVVYRRDEPLNLTGDVEIKNLVYRKNIDIESEIISKLFSGRRYRAENIEEIDRDRFPVRFDLRVLAENNIRIQTNLITSNIFLDTRLTGTPEKPELEGQLTLKGGTILYKGNEFVIARGLVNLETDIDIKAYVDISADTEVRRASEESAVYRINLHIFGPQDNLAFKLSSTPWEEETNLISLLLFGDFLEGEGLSMENLAFSAVTDMMGISRELRRSFKLYKFELIPRPFSSGDDKTERTELVILAVKELYPFLFLDIESGTVSTYTKVGLRYSGRRFNLIFDWNSENMLKSDFGAFGFNIKFDHVFE